MVLDSRPLLVALAFLTALAVARSADTTLPQYPRVALAPAAFVAVLPATYPALAGALSGAAAPQPHPGCHPLWGMTDTQINRSATTNRALISHTCFLIVSFQVSL